MLCEGWSYLSPVFASFEEAASKMLSIALEG
jgi:hypothetical protein